MVCSVAFGGSVLMSLFAFFGHRISGDWGESGVKWMYALLQEVIALGLLSFVLARRGKGLSYLGLQWSWKQAAIVPLLWFGSFVAYSVWNPVLTWCWQWQTWHPERVIFTEGISYTTFLFQFINPIFEELIVRAYLMTEVKSLTGNDAGGSAKRAAANQLSFLSRRTPCAVPWNCISDFLTVLRSDQSHSRTHGRAYDFRRLRHLVLLCAWRVGQAKIRFRTYWAARRKAAPG